MSTGASSVRARLIGIGLGSLVSVLLSSASLGAQEVTGTLYGRVVDQGALPLPGATITITSPQLIGGAQVLTTNDKGLYRAPVLPPGVYAVKAEMSGFKGETSDGVQLKAGMALSVDFALKVATVEETVTVVGGAPLVDVKNSQMQNQVGESLLQALPIGRSFHDAVITIAGVTSGEYGFAPVQTVHGGSVRDNRYTIDGTGANDTTVGYMQQEIPYDMLQEVQVTTGGISAEFGQASGGVFNFVTKSGGDQFHGSGSFFGQSKDLSSTNLTSELKAQGLTQGSVRKKFLEEGGSLGGPIMRQKLWFFGNLRWLNAANSQPDFPVDVTTDQRQGFFKLTSALTQQIHAEGSVTQEIYEVLPDFSTSGVSAFAVANSPENWRRLRRNPTIYHGGMTWVIKNTTFLEARGSRSFKQFHWSFPNNPQQTAGYLDVDTLIESGGITAVPLRIRKKMDEGMFQANVSHFADNWFTGSHNFKAGVYLEGSPFVDQQLFPNGEDFVQLLKSGQPYRIRLYRTPITTSQNIGRYVGFVQDQWSLNDRVTLNLGVRFESTEGWDGDQQFGGHWFPTTTFSEQRDLIKLFTTAPRLGFVWSLGDQKQTAFKASYGRYYDSILVTNVPNAVSGGTAEFDWIDKNGDRKFQDGEQGTQRTAFPAIRQPPTLDPNLRDPYVDAFNVGIDRQIGKSFGVSISGIFTRQRDILARTDLNKPSSAYLPVSVNNPLTSQPMTIYALSTAYQTVPSNTILTNPPGLKRIYKGLEIVAHKRMSDGWEFQGSLNLARADGNVGNSFGSTTGGGVYSNPNLLINGDGPLDLDATFQLKLSGTYQAPYGILLSSYYSGISGYPLHPSDIFPDDPAMGAYTLRFSKADNPAIIVEPFIQVAGVPRGTYRGGFRNLLSFRGAKDVKIGRTKLALTADVFNALNISTVTAVQTLKPALVNFLRPATIENPRALRLGVRFEF
jgi:TonB dependent receptor/Carboxypeptidase regulatory-like domain